MRCDWRNGGAHVSGNIEQAAYAMQANSCADVDTDSCSDRHAHACADIDSYAVADRHADACADVDVRACLHARYHARCGLTGTHAQACTMPHARAHAHAHNQGLPAHNVTELFTSVPGPRWDGADTGAHPRGD